MFFSLKADDPTNDITSTKPHSTISRSDGPSGLFGKPEKLLLTPRLLFHKCCNKSQRNMRNLSTCRGTATPDRRGSAAGLGPNSQQHAKYKVCHSFSFPGRDIRHNNVFLPHRAWSPLLAFASFLPGVEKLRWTNTTHCLRMTTVYKWRLSNYRWIYIFVSILCLLFGGWN